ncbi:MAG: DUF1501 domain-containing protein [Betaproteobacteria bacterium]|nr:DUF1501 domain-containing protein [Betaproteobacteria bacterium]
MHAPTHHRRQFLQGLAGLGLGAALPFFGNPSFAADNKRILVVVELTGANDGFNTLVPYADDAYYRLRPKIGIRPNKLRKIDDQYGFNPGMAGFERLFKEGQMAVVHGCGYDNPSYSHFTSAAYWHTGVPNGGEPYGWLGRLADAIDPQLTPNFLVNIDERQSLAVRAAKHVPVVFDDPDRFGRKGLYQSRPLIDTDMGSGAASGNASQQFLEDVAQSARQASAQVRAAWRNYKTPVDYGILPMDLPKVAAMINAQLHTRIYQTAYRHNAFDTHVHQAEQHQRLLTYVSDGVSGFMQDMKRIGRDKDVTVMVYSEFGRRAAENTSLGTDHGTANQVYLVGQALKGGHYGQAPSLTDLNGDGNVQHTTDFRRVYATLMSSWMGADSQALLNGKFEALPVFA